MSVHGVELATDSQGIVTTTLWLDNDWVSGHFSSSFVVNVAFKESDGSPVATICNASGGVGANAKDGNCPSTLFSQHCSAYRCTGTTAAYSGTVTAEYSVCAPSDSSCRGTIYSVNLPGVKLSASSGGVAPGGGGGATTTSPASSNGSNASSDASGSSGGGISTALIAGIVVALLTLCGGGFWLWRRRTQNSTTDKDAQSNRVRSFHYDANLDSGINRDAIRDHVTRAPRQLPSPPSPQKEVAPQQQNWSTPVYAPSFRNEPPSASGSPRPISKDAKSDYELAVLNGVSTRLAEPRYVDPVKPKNFTAIQDSSNVLPRTETQTSSSSFPEHIVERDSAARTVQIAETSLPGFAESAVISTDSVILNPEAAANIISKYKLNDAASQDSARSNTPTTHSVAAPTIPVSKLTQQPERARTPVSARDGGKSQAPTTLDALLAAPRGPAVPQLKDHDGSGEPKQAQRPPRQQQAPQAQQPQPIPVYTTPVMAPTPQGYYAATPVATYQPMAAAYNPYPNAAYAYGAPATGATAYPPTNMAMYNPAATQQYPMSAVQPQQQQPQAANGGGFPGYYDHMGNYHYYNDKDRA
ncbi:hypothetical protein BC830DRAFT_319890 [Chytriomyces sp. MP71]|nr:hypothetical protein BC830DRAFT_319890 [Chytriomyces sp. MP71]